MAKVIRLKKPKDSKAFKIEGDLFKKVRVYNRKVAALQKELDRIAKDYNKQARDISLEMWDIIYKETGFTNSDDLILKEDYEELGFYIVERKRNLFEFEQDEED